MTIISKQIYWYKSQISGERLQDHWSSGSLSFFRLPENFEHINNLNETDLEKYVVAGVTIVNLTSMTVMKNIFLDLTMVSYRGYFLGRL